MISMTKQVICLPPRKGILILQRKSKLNPADRNENINIQRFGFKTVEREKRCRKNICIYCHVLIIILPIVWLSLFKREKITLITFCCRFTNTGFFALSTSTVHGSMTPIVSVGKDQTPTVYIITSSISMESNSIFNYVVHDKMSDLFNPKKSKFRSTKKK